MKEIRNSFEQEMVDNGYNIFTSSFNTAIRGFQKRIKDDKGTKYFITIWHYNHAEQLQRSDIEQRDSYTTDSQFRFNKGNKDCTCNIEFWGDTFPNEYREVTTLKDIENFFEEFFNKMQPDYYELWH
jgi:hypothetical protein